LTFSRFAGIRLGGPDAKPDFSVWSWFAMLFSAGMGIGLLFYSVAEPMLHYVSPPFGIGGTVEAARLSMGLTFFHWGLHAWGIYAQLGVAMAYFTFVWLTVFGNTALFEELFVNGGIASQVQNNIATALFILLEKYPFPFVTSLLGIIVTVTFFVTSSDSASLVIDIITAGGNTNPPVQQRIFWGILQGIVAATLLVGGGLQALQTAVLLLGLPFIFVLLLVCVSLIKGLHESK